MKEEVYFLMCFGGYFFIFAKILTKFSFVKKAKIFNPIFYFFKRNLRRVRSTHLLRPLKKEKKNVGSVKI
jgi:hypothetical protein